ncbi:hypothetical protein ACFWDI_36490 [Streptomyces sp. NPDC060064]|uniref:hypothetical protein n=1 Tax=Streptomyces sp. NPDC060064 TaxID=3347049 RepID=UPI00368C37F2
MSARQTAAKKAAAAPTKPEEQEPAQEPAAPEPEAPAPDQAYVDALQREREGYVRYDRTDRLKDVDAELNRLGAPLERAVTRPPETA